MQDKTLQYKGVPVEHLSKEELVEALYVASEMIQENQRSLERWAEFNRDIIHAG